MGDGIGGTGTEQEWVLCPFSTRGILVGTGSGALTRYPNGPRQPQFEPCRNRKDSLDDPPGGQTETLPTHFPVDPPPQCS